MTHRRVESSSALAFNGTFITTSFTSLTIAVEHFAFLEVENERYSSASDRTRASRCQGRSRILGRNEQSFRSSRCFLLLLMGFHHLDFLCVQYSEDEFACCCTDMLLLYSLEMKRLTPACFGWQRRSCAQVDLERSFRQCRNEGILVGEGLDWLSCGLSSLIWYCTP